MATLKIDPSNNFAHRILNSLNKSTGILSSLNINLDVRAISREITESRLKELEVLGADEAKAVGSVLTSMEAFNAVIRDQIREMRAQDRHKDIAQAFSSILSDANRMKEHISKQASPTDKPGIVGEAMEGFRTLLMNRSRGSIEKRFELIQNTCEEVAADVNNQVTREVAIAEAYGEFKIALHSCGTVTKLLEEKAQARRDEYHTLLEQSQANLEEIKASGGDIVAVGEAEAARNAAQRSLETEERRLKTATDFKQQLLISEATTEAIMTSVTQNTFVKNEQHRKFCLFLSTNKTVLSGLMVGFTQLKGMHESTQSQAVMEGSIDDALGYMSKTDNTVIKQAMKAAYEPTVKAESIEKLMLAVAATEQELAQFEKTLGAESALNHEKIEAVLERGRIMLEKNLEGKSIDKADSIALSAQLSATRELAAEEPSYVGHEAKLKSMSASVSASEEKAAPSTPRALAK